MAAMTSNHKKATMTLQFKIETCNKNRLPQSLGQSSICICYQPSWIAAITKNNQNGYQDGWQHDNWLKMATKGPIQLNYYFTDVWVNVTSCEFSLIQLVTKLKFVTPWYFRFWNTEHQSAEDTPVLDVWRCPFFSMLCHPHAVKCLCATPADLLVAWQADPFSQLLFLSVGIRPALAFETRVLTHSLLPELPS